MRTAVCPGSFDPPTVGHIDIIRRAALLFDKVYIAVLVNATKKPSFTMEERCAMLNEALEECGVENAVVEGYEGLTVEYAKEKGALAMVRGVRGEQDMGYEQSLEAANKFLDGGIETVYLASKPELSFISSSVVKEIASYGRDISGLVPESIKNKIAERLI